MKRFIVLIYALCTVIGAFATGQDGDIIYIDGERWELLGSPITDDLYTKMKEILPEGRSWTTANWEGYTIHWSIKDNKLLLDSITVNFYNKKTQQYIQQRIPEADMCRVFMNYYQKNDIVATWATARIRAAKGNLVYYEHEGYTRNLEYEQIFTIDKGIVTDRQSFHNKVIDGFSRIDIIGNREKIKEMFPLHTEAYPELKDKKSIYILVKDIRVDSSGNLMDCNVTVKVRTHDDEQNFEGLANEVKDILKKIHPWRTLLIYGEYIAADRYGFAFRYDLK